MRRHCDPPDRTAARCRPRLLGSPDYYRRLGFVPAAELGVTAPDPAWGEHFQATGPRVQGAFRYAEPFSRL